MATRGRNIFHGRNHVAKKGRHYGATEKVNGILNGLKARPFLQWQDHPEVESTVYHISKHWKFHQNRGYHITKQWKFHQNIQR